MKQLLAIVLFVLSLTACTKNEVEGLTANRYNVPETITIGFEGTDDTRVELNDATKTVWTEGDELSVFYYSDANNKFTYQGKTGERIGEIKFTQPDDSTVNIPGVVTVYPYNSSYQINALTAGLITYLPDLQRYKPNSYGENGNIMIAYSNLNQFTLQSIYGWLRIDITGEGQKVSSIYVKGNNNEQMAGIVYIDSRDATMTLSNSKSDIEDESGIGNIGGSIITDGDIIDTVILDCEGEVELTDKATTFYVAIPPQTFTDGFSVIIYCTNGTMMTKEFSNLFEIKRNHIHPMSSFNYEGTEGKEPGTNVPLPKDSDPSNIAFHHRVLLIEHSGVNCGNCPRVMSGVHALAETEVRDLYNFAEIHGGAFAPSDIDNAYSDAAVIVDNFYSPRGYPDIRFNFYDGEGDIGSVYQFVEANSQILKSLAKEDGAWAGIAASSVADSSSVKISIGVKAAKTQEYKVTAWLLEDNVYNPNQAGATEEYHTNRDNILRYIAGTYSEDDLSGDSLGIIYGRQIKNYEYEIPIDSNWVCDNMNILIIVSAANKSGLFEVVNTALCPIGGSIGYEYIEE